MYSFSKKSITRLSDCDTKLRLLATESIKESPFDFGITCGFRDPEIQRQKYLQGRQSSGEIVTNCDGYLVKSKHNYLPSKAFDICVYNEHGEITWNEEYFKAVGAHIKETAKSLNIKIKWPIRLNANTVDWPHIELDE